MRLTKAGVAALVAAALGSSAAIAQTPSAIDSDALAFGVREGVANMDISPSGKSAVFVGPGPGRTTVVYYADIAAGTTAPILSSTGNPESLSWCAFVSDRRIACRFHAMIKTSGELVPASRMIAIDTDGKNIKELGQRASSYDVGLRQYDGSIIDWLPGGSNEVLMTRVFLPEGYKRTSTNVNRTKEGIGVVRVDVTTLKADIIEQPRTGATDYMSDGHGNVRLLGVGEIKGNEQTGRVKYLYRQAGSREWLDLVGYQEDEFVPLAIDASIDSLYALRKQNGRFVLIRRKLDGDPVETLVAKNPKVDIDDVVRSGDGQRVIGYTFADDKRETVYFDPEYRALSASLGKALPKYPIIRFDGTSNDGTKTLLYAGSDDNAGRYYLFDRANKSLGELMPVRPQLDQRKLANVQPISFPAADGTSVPAYLTLPVGKDPKNLPAVVLPHGGPSARDEWGFDWLSQFLAARGYAVIQPNFRGSAGFGDAWLQDNGFKSWRTSIGDVTAAARYLAARGIADPKRMAIVGWSYGGYAALQSAATDPSLFKAVVAIAPVTDLAMLKGDWQGYSNSRIVNDFVGSGPHLEQGSPLRHAEAIKVPVLLVHGDLDLNVRLRHSTEMDAALRRSGGQSELLMFKGLDHQLVDSDARALMLAKMGALLDRTIGH